MNGGPSHVDTVRLQARAEQAVGRGHDRRPRPRRGQAPRLPVQVRPARRVGPVGLGGLPAPGQARRRPLRHPQHAHRPAEPLAGVHADAHRQLPVRPAVGRGLDALRPGQRERQPARLRHAEPAVGQRRRAELRQRLPPRDLPGDQDRRQPDPRLLRRPARQGRGAGPAAEEHRQRRHPARPPAGAARPGPRPQPAQARARRLPPRDRRGDRVVRAGVPHAGRGPRGARHAVRARVDPQALRRRPGPADRPLRPPVHHGPSPGGGRRAVHRDHRPGRLGPPLPAQGRAAEELRRHRPADRRRC